MKSLFVLLFLTFFSSTFGQQINYNTTNGFVANGYDVVSYFTSKKPLEGNSKYQTTYNGVKFQFVSEKNVKLFKENPTKYIPQYGGFCAYAIAEKKVKMGIDAESFEIRDGKLYLFYNGWFSNKLEDWKEEDTAKLQKKGDKNWKELKYKKN